MLKTKRRQGDEPRHVIMVEEGAKEGVYEKRGEAQATVESPL